MLIIERTKDENELADLNQEMQEWHASHYPNEFKPFEKSSIAVAFKSMIEQKDAFAFVTKLDNLPIAYILCFIKKRSENAFQFEKTILHIDQLMVKTEYRNQGIGRKLIDEVEKLAKQLNISEMQLDFWETNSLANDFFSNSGFNTFRLYMKKHINS